MRTRMEWKTLLCSHALGDANSEATAARNSFVSDLDCIIFSAPFRRLANKSKFNRCTSMIMSIIV